MAKRLTPDESHFLMLASTGLELSGSGSKVPLDAELLARGVVKKAEFMARFAANSVSEPLAHVNYGDSGTQGAPQNHGQRFVSLVQDRYHLHRGKGITGKWDIPQHTSPKSVRTF